MNWGKFQRKVAPYVFISPFFIGYAVFSAYPVLHAFYLSFFKQTGIGTRKAFIALGNYGKLFQDDRFLHSVLVTTYYAAGSVFVIVPLALLLALVLSAKFLKLKGFFRLLFFVPLLTSSVVVAIIFSLVFNERYGLLNNWLLAPLGLSPVRWLLDPRWVMPSIIFVGIWRWTGINSLYFLAGLQGIPDELKEAAVIDGASRWQVFRHITLPLLRPVTLFVVVLAIIGSYNLFGEPYVLLGQETGPSDSGLFMTIYLYLTGFRFLNFGYAAAIAYAMMVIILVWSLLQLRLFGVFREA